MPLPQKMNGQLANKVSFREDNLHVGLHSSAENVKGNVAIEMIIRN